MNKRASAPIVVLDFVTFVETTLVNWETGEPFTLTAAERRFARRAFQLTPDGRLKYPELVFSAPMKSGKTTFAAMVVLYMVLVLGGRFAEGICCANDHEQSTGRVFQAIARIIEASPMLASDAVVNADKITFKSTGSTIVAIPSNYASAAGQNPTIVVFDELWGFVSERAHRLWDELPPPPTRKIACRLTVTYAGFEGESVLLESLYKRGMKGRQIAPDLYVAGGLLMYWTHAIAAPWQDAVWVEQMREQLRPSAFLRRIENRWVSSESTFVELAWWDACTDQAMHPVLADPGLSVWIGVDASVKRDSTALVCCSWDAEQKRVRLVAHKVFTPSPDDPINFEWAIEGTLIEWSQHFNVREIRYDPFQMAAVSQWLAGKGLPMVEFAQSVPNLTESSTCLFELIKGGNIAVYPDAALRLSIQRAVAIETSRGWRIAKEKQTHKIDVVVALGMAALGAVRGGIGSEPMKITPEVMRAAATVGYVSRRLPRRHRVFDRPY
jgi:phage terminase large subunit-like protein